MAEGDYKVQVSLSAAPKGQYQKGNMLNVRGDSKEEIEFHLSALFGAEMAASILKEFVTQEAVANVQAGFPGAQVQPQAGPAPVAQPQGFQPPAQGFQGAPAPQPQAPAQGQPQGAPPVQGVAPTCGLCGASKESRNGQYGQFWSCPNWSNDQHRAAKAAGQKF